MKKALPTILCAVALFGCRTHPVTPDESWADYGRYYSPTGETAIPACGAVDCRRVSSGQADAAVANLKSQGYVVLGSFLISDGTDITQAAVTALATKLNASAVVWSAMTTSSHRSALPNPEMNIAGTEADQSVRMNARRPDESFAEQTMQKHTIYMLGKKN